MPIDDPRTRPPAPRPAAEVGDAERDHEDMYDEHGGELNPTPERLAEIEAAWLAEAQDAIRAIEEGRETLTPWEEVRARIFAPATPEELAALPPRRARRR